MNDRNNTIAGWVLFAGIIALGASIVTGEVFHAERPETMGYPIEGVEVEGEGGAEAEKPIAFYLATADVAKGEAVFKKCAACHNADPGGANALGPALFGTMGKPIAGHPGFAYSDALKGVGGTWDWEKMSTWLANPKKFAPGTKMTFAGLSNPQDRADLMLWMNGKGGGLTVPPPPAEDAAAAGDKAAAEAEGAGAQKASNEPVLNTTEDTRGKGEGDAQGQ
jgi:cytochrome c